MSKKVGEDARVVLRSPARSIRMGLGVLAGICLLPVTAPADVFVDDFNRPDGALQDPWTPLEELLYIESARVVANANEFGLMGYFPSCLSSELSLEADFSFGGDTDQGRFQFYIGGGSSDEDAHGFVAIIEIDQFRIRWFLPEEDLVFGAYAFSPLATYKMRLHYAIGTQVVTLTIMDESAGVIDEIQATRATDALGFCAIGLENSAQARKWTDNVRFEHACDIVSVPQVTASSLHIFGAPNPFASNTIITFGVPATQHVEVSVFDVLGERIAVLTESVYGPGHHQVRWDGRDERLHPAAPGVYLVRVRTGAETRTHKLVLAP